MEITPKSKLARKRRATKLSTSKTYSSPRNGTPPKSSCSTPLVSYQSQDNDLSQSNFEQESCSPILLTQQGSRGDMDVVWDWNSPQRRSSNRRPSKKISRRSRKVIAASPLVQRPVSRKTSEIEIKGFAKLQEELLAIKHKIQPGSIGTSAFQSQKSCTSYQDTTVTHHRSAESRNQNPADVKNLEGDIIHFDDSETDLLFLDVDIPEDNKYNTCNNNDAQLKHDVKTSASFSDFFKDDSFIEACMYQCSQQAENEYLKQKNSIVNSGPTDLNKNSLESNQCDKFNNDNIRKLQNKSPAIDINSKSKQLENYDSLDYILSAYPDSNFCTIDTDLNTRSNNKKKCSTTSVHSVNNTQNKLTPEMTSSSLNQVNTVNKNSFNINKPTTLIDNNKIINNIKPFANNSNKNTMLSLCKPPPVIQPTVSVNVACSSLYGSSRNGLSRHNSMPVPVPGQARNVLGRHNSMPISPQKALKLSLSSERTGSVDSINSPSCSPLQCTPDEIEKKRQDARKRFEARQQQSELERKRQEAINRLQRKNPTKTLGICLHQKQAFPSITILHMKTLHTCFL